MKTKLVLMMLMLVGSFPLYAQESGDDLKLSLDKLFSLKVTSVSGTAMDMKKSPAAIYVITNEDFKTQGYRTVADALTAVPGFHVKKASSSVWSITSRGFGDVFADKLLVLIDGRSVYTPLFSGVYWALQDIPIEDIDRVEVIRGPGATLWGANAVNGVINVVTKNTRETEAGYLKFGLGSQTDYAAELRWSEQLGDDLFYKVWTKTNSENTFKTNSGDNSHDDWDSIQAGLRLDWFVTAKDTHSLQININQLNLGGTVEEWVPIGTIPGLPPLYNLGARNHEVDWDTRNILYTWDKSLSLHSGWSFKTYFDYTSQEGSLFSERRETFDIDFRNWFNINPDNSFIWGLNYRTTRDYINGTSTVSLDPSKRRVNTWGSFLQNTTQINERVSLMYGSKIEYNEISELEIQPSVRLTYDFSDKTVVWFSISRAVRTPSRADDDVSIKLRIPEALGDSEISVPMLGTFYLPLEVSGTRDLDSEELMAYEAGLRTDFYEGKVILDAAVFYNDYSKLRTYVAEAPDPGPRATLSNDETAETYGYEMSLKYLAREDLSFLLNYTFFKSSSHGDFASEQQDSKNLVYVQANYKLSDSISWHTTAYYADNVEHTEINKYVNLDSGLIWTVSEKLSVSVWGKNLLDPQHPEAPGGFFNSEIYEVPRSVFAELTYKF